PLPWMRRREHHPAIRGRTPPRRPQAFELPHLRALGAFTPGAPLGAPIARLDPFQPAAGAALPSMTDEPQAGSAIDPDPSQTARIVAESDDTRERKRNDWQGVGTGHRQK